MVQVPITSEAAIRGIQELLVVLAQNSTINTDDYMRVMVAMSGEDAPSPPPVSPSTPPSP